MKLKLLLLTFFSVPALIAGATKLTISVQDFSFTPATATINLGDTVVFTWVNGMHTTTSKTIPSGAASWDQLMDSEHTTFVYVPTVPGVYNYVCTPHEAMGQVGTFTVNGGTGISTYQQAKSVFDLYPNPAADKLTLSLQKEYKDASVILSDIAGRKILFRHRLSGRAELDIAGVPDGLYFVNVIVGNERYVRKLTIRK